MTLIDAAPSPSSGRIAAAASCHGDHETLLAAAAAAGSSETVARLRNDYPRGPHDQPQSMCPAFGSLRVGLRMRRTATILCGSACCVYGLTFTSHFYGARRTVGYVPFNSETLVKGQVFEDIRGAVFETAKPDAYDCVVVINLCVPTASGVPLDLLPKEIGGVRIIGIDVLGFGVPTHAEAKDVLSGAMLRFARLEAEQGPVQRPRQLVDDEPMVAVIGELFPADPVGIGVLLAPMGLRLAPQLPAREWRDLYAALDCVVAAAAHPFYVASVREFRAAGRPIVGSGPVGVEGTAAWLDAIGTAAGIGAAKVDQAKALALARQAITANPVKARITVSGYEGSELLVARLLAEAGAEIPMSAPPVRAPSGAIPTATGSKPAEPMSSTALRSSRISRRWRTSSPIWRSAPRRWCRKQRSAAFPPSISPISFRRGRCSGRRARPRSPASLRRRPGRRSLLPHGGIFRQGRRRRTAQRRASFGNGRVSRCWCSIMTGPAAIGERSTPLLRSKGCASSSTGRSDARTCR
jgi:chlorophyllide reductase subunit Y